MLETTAKGRKMENYKQVKKFERIIIGSIFFGLAILVLAISSFVVVGKARKKNADYDNMILSLKEQKTNLTEGVEYRNSSVYLEEQARYHYSMIKKGETYYIFED